MFGRRSDAKLAERVPAYRRIMPFLMPSRTESAVYFEQQIDVTKASGFTERWNAKHADMKTTIFHVVLWGIVRTLDGHPRLNRFVMGGRLWQRDGIWISYSAKKSMSDRAPVVVLKREFDPVESFEAMMRGFLGGLQEGRSDEPSHVDKELRIILAMPSFAVRLLMWLGRLVDSLGLLPASLIHKDPMYASVFVANLGSLKMDAAYHHLFEYGNCPIFLAIGRTQDQPVAVGGEVLVRPVVTLRYTYDERIEDGFYAQRALAELKTLVEDPVPFLGEP